MEILTKRLAYIDAMRGFTMILVVFSHVQYFGYGEFIQSVYNFCGGSCLIYRDLITLFFMPLFFFHKWIRPLQTRCRMEWYYELQIHC